MSLWLCVFSYFLPKISLKPFLPDALANRTRVGDHFSSVHLDWRRNLRHSVRCLRQSKEWDFGNVGELNFYLFFSSIGPPVLQSLTDRCFDVSLAPLQTVQIKNVRQDKFDYLMVRRDKMNAALGK